VSFSGFFQAPGLVGDSFYRARRADLRGVLMVTLAVAGALYGGATEIMRLVGIPSLGPEPGMSDYMFVVILHAAGGALGGALAAWPIGVLWESWHRRRRAARQLTASKDP
jgi:hypothetical protein